MARRQVTKQVLVILLGSLILSFGVYNFNYQNNITEGGVLGLLLLLKNVFDVKLSIASIIIDLSLLIMGYKFLGKVFMKYSLIATTSFSLLYNLFEKIGPLIPKFQNGLMGCIVAGIFVGVGTGLVVRTGAAAGGDDALALVISKTTSLNVGKVYLCVDIIVLGLSLVYLPISQIGLSLISVAISGKLIDVIYNYRKTSRVAYA